MLRAAIVLAGGSSRRLGQDKLSVMIGTHTVLDLLLDGLAAELPDVPIIAVGPARRTSMPVRWVREEPPGGGPVSGLARGLDELASSGPAISDEDFVLALAGDLPFAASAIRAIAVAAQKLSPTSDGVVAVDGDGHVQPLLAAYRCDPLRAAIGDEVSGRSVRSVLALLSAQQVTVPSGSTLDVDTAGDVTAARSVHIRRCDVAESREVGDRGAVE